MATKYSNLEVSRLLNEVASAYEAKEGNPFKIRAYKNAAASIEHATSEIKDLWEEEKLSSLPGIGKNIEKYVSEYLKTGKVKHFSDVKKGLPLGMFGLLELPGIGAKSAYLLAKELRLTKRNTALTMLKSAAKKGKIAQLSGFGEKSQSELLENLEKQRNKPKERRLFIHIADQIAQELILYLSKNKKILRADPLGSLRRMTSTVGDIDISAQTDHQAEIIDYFIKYPEIDEILEKGEVKARVLLNSGHQVDFYTQKCDSYGSLLQHLTGSKNHNISLRKFALENGMSLSENGIKRHNKLEIFKTEESFYRYLGLEYIEPEMREDTGEIKASFRQAQGKPDGLPNLVEITDIKGDIHTHTNLSSDGTSAISENVNKAISLGYQYLGISDHAPSVVSRGKDEVNRLIDKQNKEIEQINESHSDIRVLHGLEVVIKADESLAVPNDILSKLDYVIGSIHTKFNMTKSKMTKRIIAALENPYVKIIGHPTGRLLNSRESYEVDWKKIFKSCVKHKKILEINAYPERLDLPDSLVRDALNSGVKLIINTDAHDVNHFDFMKYGVSVARRGWAEKKNIINTLPLKEFLRELGVDHNKK